MSKTSSLWGEEKGERGAKNERSGRGKVDEDVVAGDAEKATVDRRPRVGSGN